jgi:hypothetical protein
VDLPLCILAPPSPTHPPTSNTRYQQPKQQRGCTSKTRLLYTTLPKRCMTLAQFNNQWPPQQENTLLYIQTCLQESAGENQSDQQARVHLQYYQNTLSIPRSSRGATDTKCYEPPALLLHKRSSNSPGPADHTPHPHATKQAPPPCWCLCWLMHRQLSHQGTSQSQLRTPPCAKPMTMQSATGQ